MSHPSRLAALAAALAFGLGGVAATALLAPDAAWAKNEGNGRDDPPGHDGRDNPGRDAPGQDKDRTAPSAKEHGPAHPSELGALNAARANPRAFERAATNSRVGQIAAYKAEVERTQALEAELAAARDRLRELEKPERSLKEIEAAIDAAKGDVDRLKDELAGLEADLAAAGGTDPAIEGRIADAKAELDAARSGIDALRDEKTAAKEYAGAREAVKSLKAELETRPATEQAAIEAAANKPVTEEVVETVKGLLGLLD
jgi:hypothetical protein